MNALLDCLEGVKPTAPGRWLAKCPAHDDRSPSLSLRLVEDRWLIKCFAGCGAADVVSAVGLELHDLLLDKACTQCGQEFHPLSPEHELCGSCFKGQPDAYHRRKPSHRQIPARDLLEAIDHEAHVCAVIAADVHANKSIDDDTWHRLSLAVSRIGSARVAQ